MRGRLVVREPPGTDHGRIQANLTYFVSHHVRQHGLGLVFGQDTGFRIESDLEEARVFRPDGSLTTVGVDGSLDGEAVLPGFSCPIVDVLR